VSAKRSAVSDDWQRLWFATRQKDWSSIAIIPSDASIDGHAIAESLASTGQVHGARAVTLLDARGVQLDTVHQFVDSLQAMTARGEWVIVPVDPVGDNPTAIPIVQATSGALLVVRLGESLLGAARTAVDTIGRDRFLGSIVVSGRAGAPRLHLALPILVASICLRLFLFSHGEYSCL
jgi:hypothetical protein